MATIDSYLDELLAADAPPVARVPLTVAASAPAVQADSAAMAQVDPDLMAELMSDPALSGGPPADAAAMPAHVETSTAPCAALEPAIAQVDPDLMAELMNDPALSGSIPSDAVVLPAHVEVVASHAGDEQALAGIDPDLLAELMSDPALNGGMQVQAAHPSHPVEAPAAPVVERAPAASRAPSMPDLSAFLPPAASPIAPVARAAVAAAAAPHGRTATGGNRWLRVCVGGDSYAFELLRVQEVVRVAPVVAMRGAGHAVLGVMNLRGRIVPVFDLGLWLDVGAVHAEERSRIVVIERNDELIGVLVTAVEDVVSLQREHVEPPLLGTDPGPTLGVARVTAAPTVLLDADALFD